MILEESSADDAPRVAATDRRVRHRHLPIDGVRVFYREAGDRAAPTVLLLHGFPSSSHMHRHLIPELAQRWHVVAPDYPGFGYSDFPPATQFEYSFASYARLVERFTQALGLQRYAIYLQDYGAPVGLRLALAAPQRVSALIVQNGNAYDEGLSDAWDPLKAYWAAPRPVVRRRRHQPRAAGRSIACVVPAHVRGSPPRHRGVPGPPPRHQTAQRCARGSTPTACACSTRPV